MLVLSGAVLTSFVGVTGLARRMALDRVLPQFLLRENKTRGTNHWILIGFFALCVSILLITRGEISSLAGVYTLAFLSVMALFAIGNMLLKVKRARLPRAVRASWPTVTFGLVAVLLGLLGNIILDPINVEIFQTYFLVTAAFVALMFLRREILKVVLYVSRAFVEKLGTASTKIHKIHHGEINGSAKVRRGVLHTRRQHGHPEQGGRSTYLQTSKPRLSKWFTFTKTNPTSLRPLAISLRMIDHLYPQLRIDFVAVRGGFTPADSSRRFPAASRFPRTTCSSALRAITFRTESKSLAAFAWCFDGRFRAVAQLPM